MNKILFHEKSKSCPMIYAYEDTNPDYKGLLKVGFTAIDVKKRVTDQYPTKRQKRQKTLQYCFFLISHVFRWQFIY
jgi:hypothetical protein